MAKDDRWENAGTRSRKKRKARTLFGCVGGRPRKREQNEGSVEIGRVYQEPTVYGERDGKKKFPYVSQNFPPCDKTEDTVVRRGREGTGRDRVEKPGGMNSRREGEKKR